MAIGCWSDWKTSFPMSEASDMARYIDADKFTERIKASPAFRNVDDGLLLQRVVIDILNNMPTADVAPKSEVAKEVLLELKKQIHDKAVYTNSQDIRITLT